MKLFQKRSLIIVGFIIPLLLNACGGGGGDNNNEDNRAPTVTSTSPLDAAIDVPRNNTLRATFDEDVFGVTVDETSFTLEKAGGSNTNGNVSFDGNRNVASFSPNRPLAVHAPYTATLSTAITDLSGNSLSSDYKWSFTTADGAWGEAQSIDTVDSDSVDRPQIAFDQSGNALAVWSEFDGTRRNIWSNRFNGTSWEVAEKIVIEDLGSAGSPQVAFDQSGNALAVWQQSDGTRSNIWSNRFNGMSWGGAEKIETDDLGTVFNPQIAIDHSGNALAVWSQSDGTRSNIWSNRFNGTSWEVAEKIEIDDLGGAFGSQIAIDQSGNALAVWAQDDGTRSNIWSNRFDGTNWGDAEKIETNGENSNVSPKIAIDQNHNALAIWSQVDRALDGKHTLMFNQFK